MVQLWFFVCCVNSRRRRHRRDKKVADACPDCKAEFFWSDLLHQRADLLTLQCFLCGNTYSLSNSPEQQKCLSQEHGKACKTQALINIRDIRRGDLISFYRRAWTIKYEHYAIVLDINLTTGKVTVVEFTKHLPLRGGSIVRQIKDFDRDLRPENALIRRFMPLDCLPLGEVIEKANAFVDNPSSQPCYDLLRYNCPELSTYCKTGRLDRD